MDGRDKPGHDERTASTAFVVALIEQGAKLGDDFVVILVKPLAFLLQGAKLVIVRYRLYGRGRSSLIKKPKLVRSNCLEITRFHFDLLHTTLLTNNTIGSGAGRCHLRLALRAYLGASGPLRWPGKAETERANEPQLTGFPPSSL